jgi:DNA-directed RNA polymerase specialized sigma24 family protein
MRLSEYLDRYSWSQAELARRAGISTQSVSRALARQPISRRNAEAIVGAINARERATKGNKAAAITLEDVEGLHITRLRRKKTRARPEEEEAEQEPGAADQPGEGQENK